MAAGAGLFLIALAATVLHYFVVFLLPRVGLLLSRSQFFSSAVRIAYPDRQGALRAILQTLRGSGWQLTNFGVKTESHNDGSVSVSLEISGRGSHAELLERLQRLGTVVSVDIGSGEDL